MIQNIFWGICTATLVRLPTLSPVRPFCYRLIPLQLTAWYDAVLQHLNIIMACKARYSHSLFNITLYPFSRPVALVTSLLQGNLAEYARTSSSPLWCVSGLFASTRASQTLTQLQSSNKETLRLLYLLLVSAAQTRCLTLSSTHRHFHFAFG